MTYIAAASGLVLAARMGLAVTIPGNAADAQVSITGDAVGDAGGVTVPAGAGTSVSAIVDTNPLRVGSGGSGSANENISAVIPFQLPVLTGGQTFSAASFSVNLSGIDGVANFNGDLYALGTRAAETVLGTDGYVGVFGGDPTPAPPNGTVGIQDNFLTSGMTAGVKTTSAAGNTALVAYLNALYANDPSVGGQYLFMRLSPDANPTNGATNRFRITPSDAATNFPTLTYTIVPEPSTAAAIGTVAMGLLASRRRKAR